MSYKPICIDISSQEKSKDILATKTNVNFSSSQDYPLAQLGFQHFIHAMKHDAVKELATFENKKKVYEVLFGFELNIDNVLSKIRLDFDTNVENPQNYILGINSEQNQFVLNGEIFNNDYFPERGLILMY